MKATVQRKYGSFDDLELKEVDQPAVGDDEVLDGYGAMGRPVLGLIPYFLWLMLRSRFVKQLRGPGLPMLTKKEAIGSLRELLESGKVTPIIDSTFPLSEVREAFRHMMEDETQGKVIITPVEAV